MCLWNFCMLFDGIQFFLWLYMHAIIDVCFWMFEYAHSCSEACVCMCVCYSASKPVSQLSGVLGNALGQRVQPSVAASHHAVWARADVRTTRRRKATIILSTWREGSRESRILAWGGGGGGDRWINRGAEKKQQREEKGGKKQLSKKS